MTNAPAKAALGLPMERTAYFIGETVPLALSGAGECKLEAIHASGRTTLYSGPAGALWLDTSKLAPGDYALQLNGAKVVERFTLTSPLRKSAGSLPDEVVVEEAVTELSGEIDLHAGRQEILLIHHNVVDGKLEKVVVGQ